jgi:hypothetical protein
MSASGGTSNIKRRGVERLAVRPDTSERKSLNKYIKYM